MIISTMNGSRELLLEALDIARLPIHRMRVAELGSRDIGDLSQTAIPSKLVWEWFGAAHISFAPTGQRGSVRHDMSQPIEDCDEASDWIGACDIVTNFGTTQNVHQPGSEWGQYEAFRAMHELCRVGGLMVHAVPHVEGYTGGGLYRYDQRWFVELARVNDCHIHQMQTRELSKDTRLLYVIMERRTRDLFDMGHHWRNPPTK